MKKLSIILAICIPLLMLAFVITLVYLPHITVHPQYNFVYATGSDYYWPSQYYVKDHQLLKENYKFTHDTLNHNEVLYLYNIKNHRATHITYEKAQTLNLNSKARSPDGFHIEAGTADNTFFSLILFNNAAGNKRFIQKGSYAQRLNLTLVGQFYNNFYFIGWVLNGKTSHIK